jgi:hypothetical protein
MKNVTAIFVAAIITLFFLTSCGGGNEQQQTTPKNKDSVITKKNSIAKRDTINTVTKEEEAKLRSFIFSTPGTSGWATKSDNISLDFFEDRRLHIQGPDGESTMWEGSWQLEGDKLTLVRTDLRETKTLTAKINGDSLILNKRAYFRYKP